MGIQVSQATQSMGFDAITQFSLLRVDEMFDSGAIHE